MDMTRRIIEGIHEVELEVTPEFRKPEKLSVYHVYDLLTSLGWGQDQADLMVSTEGGPMMQRTWTRLDMPGVRIVVLRPTDKTGNVTVADPYVSEVYSWKADWGTQPIEPNLKAIEDAAKFLAASYGLSQIGAMGKTGAEESARGELLELDHALRAVGWKVVASSVTVSVYEREGVSETIEVSADNNDIIVGAEVVFPDSENVSIEPPTIWNIVNRAKALESWSKQ